MRIYCITNSVNSKKYVGKTVRSIAQRFNEHLSCFGKCRVIESAIRKYGADAFTIEELATAGSKEELDCLEQFWIDRLNIISPNGYNLSAGGEGAGVVHESTRKIQSELAKSPRRIAVLNAIRVRPDVVAKHAAALRARWENQEYKKKVGWAIRTALSKPDVKAKRSAAMVLAASKPEYKKKHAAAMVKAHARPEVKKKHSDGLVAAWNSKTESERIAIGCAISAGKSTVEAKARYSATNALSEVKARRSAASTGRKHTEEWKSAQSLRQTGKKRGPNKNGVGKPRPAMAAKWADPLWKAKVLAARAASKRV